jgi:serine/threonine protein kinase
MCGGTVASQFPGDEGHAHLVPLIQAVHTSHYVFVVLPFFDKLDAFEFIRINKISAQDVKRHMRGLILGLNLLKRCGLAHFDISLENTLVRTDEETGDLIFSISDFGQARLIPRDASGNWLPIQTLRRGKEKYAAPEYLSMSTRVPVTVSCHPIDTWALVRMLFLYSESYKFVLAHADFIS